MSSGQSRTSAACSSRGSQDEETTLKCVLVGDGAVGKTATVVSYTTGGYPSEYIPTAFDTYSVKVHVNDEPIRLNICDTAGQNDLDSLRPLCYNDADVFLVCFSVVSPASFYNLATQWMPEIRSRAPNTPVIICGTQIDLRCNVQLRVELRDYGESPVAPQDGREYANECGAVEYVECSALTQQNLKQVFDTVILAGLRHKNHHRHSSPVHSTTAPHRNSFHALKKLLPRSLSRENVSDITVVQRPSMESNHKEPQPSVVMLKRRNSNTRLDNLRVNQGANQNQNLQPIETRRNEENALKKPPSKLKKGWQRLLCLARQRY